MDSPLAIQGQPRTPQLMDSPFSPFEVHNRLSSRSTMLFDMGSPLAMKSQSSTSRFIENPIPVPYPSPSFLQRPPVSPPVLAHSSKTCGLHGEGPKKCTGMNKRGPCNNKPSATQIPRTMPLCKKHSLQLRRSSSCRAKMTCGYECGAIFQYKPHDIELCDQHRGQQPCYFLKLPLEMRSRIYEYVLPGRVVGANFAHSDSPSDFSPTSTAIMKVNRQIHDEVAHTLYATKTFTIVVGRTSMTMFNLTFPRSQATSPRTGNHALQDYQMQLMLLEQQNKRRLMYARREQDNNQVRSSFDYATGRASKSPTPFESPIPFEYGLNGPAWTPPIIDRYFDRIRTFQIVFHIQSTPLSSFQTDPYSGGPIDHATTNTSMIYEYCDHLHRLIGRLELLSSLRLEIVINYSAPQGSLDDVRSQVETLLGPLKRLDSSVEVKIREIAVSGPGNNEGFLLYSNYSNAPMGEHSLLGLGEQLPKRLAHSTPSVDGQQVFQEFWKLEKLMTGINTECPHTMIFNQFRALLHHARVARENEDLCSFQAICVSVIDIWRDYTDAQRIFQENVEGQIEGLTSV